MWNGSEVVVRMRRTSDRIKLGSLLGVAGVVALTLLGAARAEGPLESACRLRDGEPLAPVFAPVLDVSRVELGRSLFHDKRLSKGDQISCATCHPVERYGADGQARSAGVDGALGSIHTPTVLNSGLNFRQFWDGRAATLEEQVDGPTHNPLEMASEWSRILGKLRADRALVQHFERVYGRGPDAAGVRDAIATYERSLVTPGSRLDRYLCGEDGALSPEELHGYELFKGLGCVSCHQGQNVGGNMYQRFGVMGDYFEARGAPTEADLGRYNVTGREEDRHVFKVPGLRNVARTAPYFHDGSARTLRDAVRTMGEYQLGRSLSDEEVQRLVAFLDALTGELP